MTWLTQRHACLIGAVLMKIGQGLIITWGKTNIYYYSYYKLQDQDLSIAYNTMPLAIIAFPAALATIFSVKIARRVGFSLLIRLCAIIQCASLIIAPFMPTYFLFILFHLMIFGFGYSLTVFPILTCIWSNYKKSEGKVTGIVFGAFGMATFLFVILITYIVNPENEQATLILHTDHSTVKYFTADVAKNVPKATLIVGIIAGVSILLGSMLVKFNYTSSNQSNGAIEMVHQVKKLDDEEQKPFDEVGSIKQIELDDEITEIKVTATLKQAIKSSQFLIILACQAILTFYLITLGMNYKTYGLSKINNDHFVTFVDMLALAASSCANIAWGFLVDRIQFKLLFCFVFMFSGITAILFPIYCESKSSFLIIYVIMMMFDKASMVLIGPGLLKIFGDQLGHQLLPITFTGTMLAFILSPIFQHFAIEYISMDIIFISQGALIILAALLISRLKMIFV